MYCTYIQGSIVVADVEFFFHQGPVEIDRGSEMLSVWITRRVF